MALAQNLDEETTAAINYLASGFLLALLALREEGIFALSILVKIGSLRSWRPRRLRSIATSWPGCVSARRAKNDRELLEDLAAVTDPNVLLSALVGKPDAAPALLLDAVHDHGLEMLACPMVMAEVRKNLEEPYFRALLDQQEAV